MIKIPVFFRKAGIFFVVKGDDRPVPGKESGAWKIIDK
jgi:hypothetical protein